MLKKFGFTVLVVCLALVNLNGEIASFDPQEEIILRFAEPEAEPVSLALTLPPGRLDTREIKVMNTGASEVVIDIAVPEWMDIHPQELKLKPGEIRKCLLFVWVPTDEQPSRQGYVTFQGRDGKTALLNVVVSAPRISPTPDPKDIKIKELEDELAAKDAKIQKLQGQIDQLKSEHGLLVEKLAQEIDLLKDEKSRLEELVAKLNQDIKDKDAWLSRLKEKNLGSEEKIRAQDAKISALQEEIARLEKDFGSVRERTKRLTPLYTKLVKELGEEISRGEVLLTLNPDKISVSIYGLFPSGSIYPRKQGSNLLTRIGVILKENLEPDYRIEVRAHTDSRRIGTRLARKYPTNHELSAARAGKVVYIFRCRKGINIDSDSLALAGYGPSCPVATNETIEGRAKNRRVEIIISIKGGVSDEN